MFSRKNFSDMKIKVFENNLEAKVLFIAENYLRQSSCIHIDTRRHFLRELLVNGAFW